MARFGTTWTLILLSACGSSHARDGVDGGAPRDSGRDAGRPADSGGTDAGTVDFTSCESSPECIVLPASCCGSCGAATPGDMVGVNEARASDQRTEACAGGGACPGCFAMQDPFLVGTCDTGACRAVDLHAHPATACSGDGDCFLWSARCCDCGLVGADRAIAISDTGELAALICAFDAPACPPCAPTFDESLRAYCDDTGHCAVAIAMP